MAGIASLTGGIWSREMGFSGDDFPKVKPAGRAMAPRDWI